MPDVGIDSLSIQIKANASNASDAIDRLVNQLENLKAKLGGFNNVNFNSQLHGTANAILSVANASQQINSQNLKQAASAMNSMANAINKIQPDSINNVMSSIRQLSEANIASFSGLGELSTAMAKLSDPNIATSANNLKMLVDPLRLLSTVNVPEGLGANIAALGSGLAKLGGKKVVDASTALPTVIEQLTKLSSIPIDSTKAESIRNLADAFKSFGYKKVTDGIQNIPKIAEAFEQLVSKINALPTVNKNTIDLANAMANLASQGSKVRSTLTALNPTLKNVGNTMKTTKKHTFNLASAIGKVYAGYWMFFRSIGSIRKAINLSSDLTEAQNVVLQAFGSQNYEKVDNWAKNLISNFGISELAAKKAASRFQAMGVAMGFSQNQMTDMSMALVERAADIGSLYNKEFEDVATDMNAVFTGMVMPLRKYGIDLTQASLKEYALSQGMDSNIKSMTQMQKAMLRYQYVLTGTTLAQGDFARTQDTWANQLKILKTYIEALGTVIGRVFINLFKPVIQSVNNAMNAILGLVEKTVNAIGKLMGWQIEVSPNSVTMDEDVAEALGDASDGASGTADGLKDANKNAKELKRTILGFDQLNVLQRNKDSDSDSGSGSGSGSGAGSGVGANRADIKGAEMLVQPYESDILSWFDLGRKISETLTKALEGIDWDSIYRKAENFGRGLAEFLNGLITPELFYALGKTIAGALNTSLHFLNTFGETFDWANFGLSIANGINGFFQNFDFALLADTINAWVQGLWTTLKTALLNIDWGAIISGIFDLLTGIDPETYAILFGAWMLKAVTSGIMQAFANKSLSGLISTGVSNMITTGFSNIWTTVGTAASLFGQHLISAVVGGMTTGNFFEAFSSVFGVIPTVFAGITTAIGGTAIAVKNFFDMWQNGWNLLDEILKDIGIALGVVGAIILGAPALVAGVVGAIVAVASTLVILIHDNWETVKGWFDTGLTYLRNLFAPVAQWVNTNIIQPVVTFWEGLKLRVNQILEGLHIIAKAIFIKIKEAFLADLQVALTRIGAAYTIIKTTFDKIWEDVQAVFEPIFTFINETVIDPVMSAFESAGEFIRGVFDNLWDAITSGIFNAFNGVITTIENKVNSIINFINPIISAFNGVVSAAARFTGDAWSGVSLIGNVHFGRFANGGFIEDGLFTMNHGEIAGKFTNGQSVVANNQQITEGIKQAVIEGMMEVYMATAPTTTSNNQGDGNVYLIVDGEEIARAVINGQKSRDKRFNPVMQY